MTTPDRVTITISVPTVVHIAIGVLFALVSLAAFWVHVQLPAGHEYKNTASDIGLLAGCTTLAYWLWCAYQRGHTENRADAANAQVREDRLAGVLQEISGGVEANRAAIKDLGGAVEESTAASRETTGAVEALQDSYLDEDPEKA